MMNNLKELLRFEPLENGVAAILPGEIVSSFRVALPKLSGGKLARVLPNIMADDLADRVDRVHLALIGAAEDGTWLVAACDKSVMQMVRDEARARGKNLKAVWPDYMKLRVPESGVVTVDDGHRTLGRHADGTGFGMSSVLIPALNLPLGENDARKEDAAVGFPAGAGLATGEFNPRPPLLGIVKYFRRAALLSLALCAVWIADIAVDIADHKAQRKLYQDRQITLFREAYPQVTRIVDVEAQLRGLTETAKGGGDSLLPLMDQVYGIIQDTPGVGIDAVRYQRQPGGLRLSVTVVSSNFAGADQVKAGFLRAGLTVEDKGGRQDGDKVFNEFELSEAK